MFIALMSLSFYGMGCNPFKSAQDKLEQKAAEKMSEKLLESMVGDNVDIDINGDSAVVRIKDEDGGGEMMFGDDVELPRDLDEGIIIYSGAKPISVIRNFGGAKGAMVTLTTQDDMNDIAVWYEKKYESAGWTKNQSMTIEEVEMRGFKKGDERVIITIGANDDDQGGNIISINLSVE